MTATHELDMVVTSRTTLAEGVVGLRLAPRHGGALPEWEPGAHIDLVLEPGLIRQYSLCSDPRNRACWRIAVLREPAGRGGSAYVHDKVGVGTSLVVRGPRNRFPLVPSASYLFIAGGIGITPLLPMVAALARTGKPWRLVYGGRSAASMAFLGELAAYGDRVAVLPQTRYGLLDLDTLVGRPRTDTAVYCCGPAGLLDAVEQRCRAWPAGSLHTERFAAPAGPAGGGAFDVVLQRSGRTVHVTDRVSILDAVRQAGVSALSSCLQGTCGTCETAVLGGAPEHRDALLTEDERAAGDVMMICVSRSSSPTLVLDL